jgi:hypothetical protein
VSKKENGKNKTEQKDCVSALRFASLSLLGENGKHDRLNRFLWVIGSSPIMSILAW